MVVNDCTLHNTSHKHGSLNNLVDAMTALPALRVKALTLPPPPSLATQSLSPGSQTSCTAYAEGTQKG